jgi:hypothetical protein
MIRRGIVVVHGIGHQQRGDQLDDVVEPVVEFLGQKLGHANVHVVAHTGRTDGADATATIAIRPDGDDNLAEQWDVHEAWWAQTFRPSDAATVLGWAVRAYVAHVHSTVQNVLERNVRRLLGRPVAVQNSGDGVWEIPVAGSNLYYAIDAISWFSITLGYFLVYLAGSLLILPLYVFVLLPGSIFWPAQIAGIQRRLVNLFSGGIGEQQALTNRHVAVAAAASAVTRALEPFLNPLLYEASGPAYDTITVIAHSGGCIVSFEALASDQVRAWCAAAGRRVTWLTLGSGLNLGWRLRARRKARDIAFWDRRIDGHVNWINIYARYDPVPQGEPPAELVRALTGADPAPWQRVRTANEDWPLTDHTSYWSNREEVIARIVHAISCSRLGREPIALVNGSHDAESLIDDAAANVAVREGRQHRRSVSLRRARALSAAVVVAALLLIFRAAVRALGEAVVAGLGLSWPRQGALHRLGENLPHAIGGVPVHDLAYWTLGALLVLYAVLSLSLLAGLARQFASWRRTERDDSERAASPEEATFPPQRSPSPR